MSNRTFYNEVLTDHNIHPENKFKIKDFTFEKEGVNPSCGDDIVLQIKYEDGVITDAAFVGEGCAISQPSPYIITSLFKGKTKEEALRLSDIFLRMIKGEASEDEIQELEEGSALEDISHMPARVKCAVLGWRTLNEILKES